MEDFLREGPLDELKSVLQDKPEMIDLFSEALWSSFEV